MTLTVGKFFSTTGQSPDLNQDAFMHALQKMCPHIVDTKEVGVSIYIEVTIIYKKRSKKYI